MQLNCQSGIRAFLSFCQITMNSPIQGSTNKTRLEIAYFNQLATVLASSPEGHELQMLKVSDETRVLVFKGKINLTDFTHVALQESDGNDEREYMHGKLSLEY